MEARRDQLQAETQEAQRRRVAARVNAHTTEEAEQTRATVRAEGQQTRAAFSAELQPLISLVAGADSQDRAKRIQARHNQIALLRAGIRKDQAEASEERAAAKRARNASGTPVTVTGGEATRPCPSPEQTLPENQEVDLVGDVPVDDGTPQEDLASEVPLLKTLESKPDPSATNLITEAELVSEAPVTGREPQNHESQRPATVDAITETDILKLMEQLREVAHAVCSERRQAKAEGLGLAYHQPYVEAVKRLGLLGRRLSSIPTVPRGFIQSCSQVVEDPFVKWDVVWGLYESDGKLLLKA